MNDFITINTHSSIKLSGEKTVYCDPFEIVDSSHDADIILVTHSHFDHYSKDDIKKIRKDSTVFVLPLSMKNEAEEDNTVFLSAGESADVLGVHIEAVPAYNINKNFHPKSNGWLGYVITLNGKRVYIAGDTDRIPENESISCDIAMVPVGGTYTMMPDEAAGFVNALRPKTAIPTHYGSVAGTPDSGIRFCGLTDEQIETKILIG